MSGHDTEREDRLEKRETDMRIIAPLVVAFGVMVAAHGAHAQSDLINGQVMKVDRSAGKITIKHGPIPKLGMAIGMTMVFKAGNPAMLRAVKSGDKVKFDADDVNGQFTVTKIEKTK
jgi:Cu(I)/Ag(I) efflux system periplasmic protein CusF